MNSSVVAAGKVALGSKVNPRWGEKCVGGFFFLCAFLSLFTTLGIIVVLAEESYEFFRVVPVVDFLFGTKWFPLFDPPAYGVLPLVCGSFMVVVGAALVAVPIGLGSAIFLSEYASPRTRSIVKPLLEVLAGIPSVVYGYFALTGITPLLQKLSGEVQVFNAASASIVVGIMILPMIASLCDDALRAVPLALRRGAFALGATRFEVSIRIVLPAALSGIVASFVLAFSRAVGETMAVDLAAGNTAKLTCNPFESVQTMTAYIVQVSGGDTPVGSISYKTLFAVGATLFLITFAANVIGQRILRRYREVYE